ncbi:MAG: transcriptional regulator [Phycisphaeraceae bacterium]|nr:transcriptional regulator [Phycisphaeraceae bacterium]|tara:strand:- start:33 stop:395 length:363 start_codon:yes stop_codon:yes gene_type:complete
MARKKTVTRKKSKTVAKGKDTSEKRSASSEPLHLEAILHALSDAVRLEIVCKLDAEGECTCATLDGGRPKSTMSHHFKVLREAGLVQTRLDGVSHRNSLCREQIDQAFPGLLDAIISAAQ